MRGERGGRTGNARAAAGLLAPEHGFALRLGDERAHPLALIGRAEQEAGAARRERERLVERRRLAEVDQPTLDRLLAEVPGGAANVQDIYPLAPLQEGILYHHASNEQGDPYVMQSYFAFSSRERLHDFAQALQKVIDRHDILRTAVLWEQLPRRCKWSGVRHSCR